MTGNNSTTILHIDDDELLLAVFGFVLEEAGFEVVSAGGGAEALQLAATTPPPGLVILDLDMPVMNGLETLDRLRQLPRFENIPVVVVSARNANDEQVQTAFQAGAAGYVSKLHLNLQRLPDIVHDYLPTRQGVT